MKEVIVNGSSRGRAGNTEIFIRRFLKGLGRELPVRYAAQEDAEQLAQELQTCSLVLLFTPLYVHAVPGPVQELLGRMRPFAQPGARMGFVVQSGFVEAAQSRYAVRLLDAQARRLGAENLGCAVRGNAAGTAMMGEKGNAALFQLLERLGAAFAETGAFDPQTVKALGTPYRLTKRQAMGMELLYRLRIGRMMWYWMLLQNRAFRRRRARPWLGDAPPDSGGQAKK